MHSFDLRKFRPFFNLSNNASLVMDLSVDLFVLTF